MFSEQFMRRRMAQARTGSLIQVSGGVLFAISSGKTGAPGALVRVAPSNRPGSNLRALREFEGDSDIVQEANMTRIRFGFALMTAALLSFPAAAQQGQGSGAAGPATTGMSKRDERDPIGLTSTQRQMIAWSIAGVAEKQASPQGFQPKAGAKLPDQLKSARIPSTSDQVADPVRNYEYVMLEDQNLLLVSPQDGTIADVIHLDRRL